MTTRKRQVWFEYSWAPGLWIWPITTKGWVVFTGAPALGLVLVVAEEYVRRKMPGSWLAFVPIILLVVLGFVVNYLVITRMQRKGELRDEDVNHTARRLFGRGRWGGGIGGGRRPAPLVPKWPPAGQDADPAD